MLLGSLHSQSILAALDTKVQAEATFGNNNKRRFEVLGYTNTVSFFAAGAFKYRIRQYAWRPRYDQTATVSTILTAAVADTNAGDIAMPGVSLLQCPLWTEKMKLIGSKTRVVGGGIPAVFTNKSGKAYSYRHDYPGKWSVASPTATVFFTYEIQPERAFIAGRHAWDHTAKLSGSSTIYDGGDAHFWGPVMLGAISTHKVEWLMCTESRPVNYEVYNAYTKSIVGDSSTSPDFLSLYTVGPDRNPHGGFNMMGGGVA